MPNKKKLLTPIHPGEILREDFLDAMNLSMNELARALGVPSGRITQIAAGKRAITADTALRLGRYFNMSPEVWLDLQSDYELRVARQEVGDLIKKQVDVRQAS